MLPLLRTGRPCSDAHPDTKKKSMMNKGLYNSTLKDIGREMKNLERRLYEKMEYWNNGVLDRKT